MKMTEDQKNNHRYALRLLAALALEHGLRFLTDGTDDAVRKLILKDIEYVRMEEDYEIERQYKLAKRRKVDYTVPGLLLQGSTAMLYLGKHGGYPPSSLVQSVFYFPTEAGYLTEEDHGKEQRAERTWQNESLWPLLRRLFDEWGNPGVLADIKKFKIERSE